MTFYIITIFPEFFDSPLSTGLVKKAREKGIVEFNFIDLKKFGVGKHKVIDDCPYGGGGGMIIKPEPIIYAIKSIPQTTQKRIVILFSPGGNLLNQKKVKEIAQFEEIVLVCPRYEGVDERVKKYIDEEISIGDYVVHSGDSASVVFIEAILRLKEGFMSSKVEEELLFNLLDFPQYTRPREFEGEAVPSILLTGNHRKIREWRIEKSVKKTIERRPDLILRVLSEITENYKNENEYQKIQEYANYFYSLVFSKRGRDAKIEQDVTKLLVDFFSKLKLDDDPFYSTYQ